MLRHFIEQHERKPEHAEALEEIALGCHTHILSALASDLNALASTTMTDARARQSITGAITRLRHDGQIAGQPEPLRIIEGFANFHTLMLSPLPNRTVGFQHQQIQEWYASLEAARLMRESASGDEIARERLRAAVLDQQAWEESILFAVERLSRTPDGAPVAAHAVRLALPIDPMLAAEMIYRSSQAVWEIVREDIVAFAERWHSPDTVDRAVRFMIITGRPEFEAQIWPLASNPNSQIQIPTLRIAPSFRPSVLGSGLGPKVAALPEDCRRYFLTLVSSESGIEGIDLATELAGIDPSPEVQADVAEHLLFRRADRQAAMLLERGADATWAILAARGHADGTRDSAILARLDDERRKLLVAANDPIRKIGLLIQQPNSPARDAGIAAALADPQFPLSTQHSGNTLYFAQQRAPAAILQGLRRRLEAGLVLPFNTQTLLAQLDIIDDGAATAALLDENRDDRNIVVSAAVAGPRTVIALLDKFLVCTAALKRDRSDRATNDIYHRLKARLASTRARLFLEAVLSRAKSHDVYEIAALAGLLSTHGESSDQKQPIFVAAELKAGLIDAGRLWSEKAIASQESQRYQLMEIARAIGRLGLHELVPDVKRLLDEDLTRLRKARRDFTDAQRRGDIRATSDARTVYGSQYSAAFANLAGAAAAEVVSGYLDDHVFGVDAARALKMISDRQQGLPEPDFRRRWPWLDTVANARADRASRIASRAANALAGPLFAVVDRLAHPEVDREVSFLPFSSHVLG